MGLNGIRGFFCKTFSSCCSDFSYTIRHRRYSSHPGSLKQCLLITGRELFLHFIYLLLSLGTLVWVKFGLYKNFRLGKVTPKSLTSIRSLFFSDVNWEWFGSFITYVVWCSLLPCVLWVKTSPLICLKPVVNDEVSIDRVAFFSLMGERFS